MDHSANSAGVFHKHADNYQEKFGNLTTYEEFYRQFCRLLPPGRARVLDAACGPGNVSRYLISQRPELDLLGIDLAPRMVELARENVPARFMVHDCRNLAELKQQFDGIICAFGLPYLSREEGAAFIQSACEILELNGVVCLSTILGSSRASGFESLSTGEQVHVTYYREEELVGLLRERGFTIAVQKRIPSPEAVPKATTDLVIIAQKQKPI